MNIIKVNSVSAVQGKLCVGYEISPELEPYFTSDRVFEVEYSEDVSAAPESVLVIPFVCNVLPIVWLADAVLEVPQLDYKFYEGIPDILKGYADMSPMLEFKGEVRVGQLVDNSYDTSDKVAAFFSGGVDAFATLIAHAEERPQLITLWGADVKLTDADGWDKVRHHVLETSRQFGLASPVLVKTNFRAMVDEAALSALCAASGEGWWYGFQHGIAIVGHAAPVAYLKRLKTVYIASTNTIKDKLICASDPTIDNKVRLVSTGVWHDQYECTRQQKVQHIVEYCREKGSDVQLRVCWQSAGGSNCCLCEKCARTLYNLLAEGADPFSYGFESYNQHISFHPLLARSAMAEVSHLRPFWQDIQDRFQETQAYRKDKRINWIYTLDVNRPLTWNMRAKHMLKQRFPFAARALRFIKRKLQGR